MVIHNRMYDWIVVAGYITRIIYTHMHTHNKYMFCGV